MDRRRLCLGLAAGLIKVCGGSAMGLLWERRGHVMGYAAVGLPWVRHGSAVNLRWVNMSWVRRCVCNGCAMDVPWVCRRPGAGRGFAMGMRWVCRGYAVGLLWVCRGSDSCGSAVGLRGGSNPTKTRRRKTTCTRPTQPIQTKPSQAKPKNYLREATPTKPN